MNFHDILEIIGIVQRGQTNRKLSSIEGHLRTQRSELIRREMLPKCPVCKLPIEHASTKCPNCHDRLVWIATLPFADTPNNVHLSSMVFSLAEQYNLHLQAQKAYTHVRHDTQNVLSELQAIAKMEEIGAIRKSISDQLARIDGSAFYQTLNDDNLSAFIRRGVSKLPSPAWLSWRPFFLALVTVWLIVVYRLSDTGLAGRDQLSNWIGALPLVCVFSVVIPSLLAHLYTKFVTEKVKQLLKSHRETLTVAANLENQVRSLQEHVRGATATFEALSVLRQYEHLLTAKAAKVVRQIPASNPFSSLLDELEDQLPVWLLRL